MWIVKNVLRGTLRFPGLNIVIPPKTEFDLDVLSREVSENSNQLKVAFEEGYLQNIRKELPIPPPAPPTPSGSGENSSIPLTDQDLEKALSRFKNKIIDEIKSALPAPVQQVPSGENFIEKMAEVQKSFSGDVEQLVKSMEEIKEKIRQEKHKVLDDEKLSNAELRARLKFLEEKEQEISKNFERIGNTSTSSPTKGEGLMEKADILSDL